MNLYTNTKKCFVAFCVMLGTTTSAIAADFGLPKYAKENPKIMATPGEVADFLNDLNTRTNNYLKQGQKMEKARRSAFRDWSKDHRSDFKRGPLHELIHNTEFPSNLGVVDMDWLATMGNLGQRGIAGRVAYQVGKNYWLWRRSEEQSADTTTFYNKYPDTNWRSLAVTDLLLSGKVDPADIFVANRRSPLVDAKRLELNQRFARRGSVGDKFRSANRWEAFTPSHSKVSNPYLPANIIGQVFKPKLVGGVDLSNTPALAGMDKVVGLSFNPETEALVIVGKHDTARALPDLNMDDVTTIFRSVYAGDPPTITIDPDPDHPDGPTMKVISSGGIKGSYVHWVLYQADRIMKSYSLGKDTLTGQPIRSQISGYAQVLDALFAPEGTAEPLRERFWITPASRTDYVMDHTRIVELPLEVQTRRMTLQPNGTLEDMDGVRSSPGAEVFSNWFTQNMVDVGQEARMHAPAERGGALVDVFAELRRFAVLTALAEQARAEDLTIPTWMTEHQIAPVQVDIDTPALTEQRRHTQGNVVTTISVYGGAQLTSEHVTHREVMEHDLPEKMRKNLNTIDSRSAKASPVPDITTETVGVSDQAVTLLRMPGSGSYVPGMASLASVDYANAQHNLTLEREIGGPGAKLWDGRWSLVVPVLEKSMVASSKKGTVRYLEPRYRLTERGESVNFGDLEEIDSLGVNGFMPRASNLSFASTKYLVRGKSPYLAQVTWQVHFKGGRILHFDEQQRFVAQERRAAQSIDMITYEWSGANRLERIVTSRNGRATDTLRLHYSGNTLKRLTTATGEITYGYDSAANLIAAHGPDLELKYDILDNLVAGVSVGQTRVGIAHDKWGRVIRVEDAEGTIKIAYRATPKTNTVALFSDDLSDPFLTTTYDGQWNVAKVDSAWGSRFEWDEGEQQRHSVDSD
ncbi:MAG: hypothetical protein AAF420_04180 [Pseudomonadota bacterium]